LRFSLAGVRRYRSGEAAIYSVTLMMNGFDWWHTSPDFMFYRSGFLACRPGKLLRALFLALGVFSVSAAAVPDAPPVAGSSEVITNLGQFYNLPAAGKRVVQPMRLELLIYYSNPEWGVFWGRSGKLNTFLPLKGISLPLKSGQKILLEGWILPINQEILWEKTTVTVLSENNPIATAVTKGLLLDTANLDRRFVEVEALVDSAARVGPRLLNLNLISEEVSLNAYVNLTDTNQPPPDFVGRRIRLRGVYTQAADAFKKTTSITLWVPEAGSIQVTGSLAEDGRFSAPKISSQDFAAADSGQPVVVAGMVHSQRPKESVTIWDEAGQIQILTQQQYPLKIGDRIEAVGYPALQGLDRLLQDGIFRPAKPPSPASPPGLTNHPKLFLTEQVRLLEQEQLVRQPEVELEGVVAWVEPADRSCFILDSSGGIRVRQAQLASGRNVGIGMQVQIGGVAVAGDFGPVVSNAVIHQTGTMNLPDAPRVSLEEALGGTMEGAWVQMRGYVRHVVDGTNGMELKLMATAGKFTARVPKSEDFKSLQGSVVLVRGVCVAVVNAHHQLTRIEIWAPLVDDVQVEHSAPENPFGLPLRPIVSLKQFNAWHSLNDPIHTYGVVTYQSPGHYLYLQDGNQSLQAMSEQTDPLRPGERVELVGFPGRADSNILLREAVYRSTGAGAEVTPVRLGDPSQTAAELNGLLVQAEGILVDTLQAPNGTQLIVQAKNAVIEAELDTTKHPLHTALRPGSRLAVTGLFFLQREGGAFRIRLRSEADIQVLKLPPWWTPFRLLLVLVGILIVLLTVIWRTFEVAQRNQLLQRARDELRLARDKLEERVHERTQELRAQIDARKRAHDRLTEAQERLMAASRQAGMAEVATGVLHNVGNVLNSVNVSAALVGDSLARFRVEQFSKAVALLNGQGDKLPQFLTDDPRGRALPGYLRDLAQAMTENQHQLQGEVKSLSKQIDHVKAIVSLQQNYAKLSNFKENLDPLEIMEDAVQINRAAFERHEIQLVREFTATPPMCADRHKTLQILINLLSNAKYAVKALNQADRRVCLRIRPSPENKIRFEVADFGIGIPAENIDRIFTLGFTTKTGGHGFGLHSGANAAKEMGGQLFVVSEGPARGATFVLELPAAVFTPDPKTDTLATTSL